MGGSVFTLAGGKGGVGKTTTTANVGIALTRQGFDVAAVDADIGMPNLGLMVDSTPEQGIHSVLAGEADLADVVAEGPGGLAVVAGEAGLPPTEAADPANLKRVITPLVERADIVLVDTGAGLSHETLVACGLADAVALVTTPDDVAVGDTGKSAELAGHVDTQVLGTVLTRATVDVDIDAVVEGLEADVVAAIPEYRDADAAEPRLLEAPESPAAAEYERLATTLAVCHKSGDLADPVAEASEAVSAPAITAMPGGGAVAQTSDGERASEAATDGGEAAESDAAAGGRGSGERSDADGEGPEAPAVGPLRGLLRQLRSLG